MVTTSAVSTVHCVAVNGHLNVEVVSSRGRPFKGPRPDRVGLVRVGQSSVHRLAEGFGDSRNFTVGDEDAVSTSTAVPVHVVDFHHVVLDGHGEGVDFASVVGVRQTIDQNRRVGRGATVASTSLVPSSADAARGGRELWSGH